MLEDYPSYPGKVLRVGTKDRSAVRAVQRRLNQVGCGPIPANGIYDDVTRATVGYYQARAVDSQEQPLKIDGVVGPLTWAALFGSRTLPSITGSPVSKLLGTCLNVAASQVGVMEEPPGSNRGPQVDEYLKAVGIEPSDDSYPWCAAFVYWSFRHAAIRIGIQNPAIRTAGVLDHWAKAGQKGIKRIFLAEFIVDFSLVKPGLVFVINTGGGKGHMGLVEDYRDDRLVTIEGNTNLPGDREGVGVFRRTGRKLSDINKGFIVYD